MWTEYRAPSENDRAVATLGPPERFGTKTPATIPRPPVAADWGRRVAASVLDAIIVGATVMVVATAIEEAVPEVGQALAFRWWTSALFVLAVWGIFSWLFEGRQAGATPGKMATSLRVARIGTSVPAGYGHAAGRAIVRSVIVGLAPLTFGLLWLANYLWPLFDEQQQTLHDKASGTWVVFTADW